MAFQNDVVLCHPSLACASVPRALPSCSEFSHGASVGSFSPSVGVRCRAGMEVPSGLGPGQESCSVLGTRIACFIRGCGLAQHLGASWVREMRDGEDCHTRLGSGFLWPLSGHSISELSSLSTSQVFTSFHSEDPVIGDAHPQLLHILFSESLQTQSLVLRNHCRPRMNQKKGESRKGDAGERQLEGSGAVPTCRASGVAGVCRPPSIHPGLEAGQRPGANAFPSAVLCHFQISF